MPTLIGLTSKQKRLFEIARQIALTSEGAGGHNGYRLGAIIADGSRIVATGTNSYNSSAKLSNYYEFPFRHAESSAVLSCFPVWPRGLDLYVVRVLRNSNMAMAKPCRECRKFIKIAGIKRVFFSTGEGFARL